MNLDKPALQIAGLKLWVHRRQFPAAEDYWDGNWLYVTAQYNSTHSSVSVVGPIVHLSEVEGLLEECECLYESLSGVAKLQCTEPNLAATLTAGIGGRIDVEIQITPDLLSEAHEFKGSIDQTFLPAIILQCRELLAEYPVRSPRHEH